MKTVKKLQFRSKRIFVHFNDLYTCLPALKSIEHSDHHWGIPTKRLGHCDGAVSNVIPGYVIIKHIGSIAHNSLNI